MKTIVWDVDDVLNDQTRVWLEGHWLPTHPECALKYTQISENPPHRLLGVSLTEYLASLDGFRFVGADRLDPVPEALCWFRQHGQRFRHVALTATPLRAAHISAAWVIKHFGHWIRSFGFVPSAREGEDLPVYDGSKAEYLRWWGKANVLVDDNPVNVDAARNLGVEVVLMPRPWNASRATIADALDSLTHLAL
jgi:hypothetical protein